MQNKLFVGGLSWDTDESGLRKAFENIGRVLEVRIITDRSTGQSKGFGFVSYTNNEDAARAMAELDGMALDGRNIRVNEANDRAPRSFGHDSRY